MKTAQDKRVLLNELAILKTEQEILLLDPVYKGNLIMDNLLRISTINDILYGKPPALEPLTI